MTGLGANADHPGKGAMYGVCCTFFAGLGREAALAKIAAAGFREIELLA